MKTLAVVFALSVACFGQTELKRPTVNSDGGTTTLGCTGTNQASTAMAAAHDAAGMTTSSTLVAFGDTLQRYKTRLFTTWQTTGNTYSALTLNINSQSAGHNLSDGSGQACLKYSIDGGVSWTSVVCDGTGNGWVRRTDSITLSPSQNLTKLRIGVCAMGTRVVLSRTGETITDAGSDNIVLWDIWTSGTVSAGAQGPGPGSTSGSPHRGAVIVN